MFTRVLSAPALQPFELTATPPWDVVADFERLAAQKEMMADLLKL